VKLKEQTWCKPAIEGTAMDMVTTKNGDISIIVHVASIKIGVGDKIGSWHRFKFTAGEIIPYSEMLSIIDDVTGKEFKPTLLFSTKNMSRRLGGLVREMAATTSLFSSIHWLR
jgi:hypothetical protein